MITFVGSPSSTDGRRRNLTVNLQENGDAVPQWAIISPKLSLYDRIGVVIESSMTKFFTIWGTNCSRYPLPVIIVSVVIAGSLCTGIQWLKVTTDPIELWASPTSRSRIERDFFGSTFRPFYRTQQIIIRARNLKNVSPFLSSFILSNISIKILCLHTNTNSDYNNQACIDNVFTL